MIFDEDTAQCLAQAPVIARDWRCRLRGMIGRRFSKKMDAMVFPRCNAVHMLFMTMPLDVLFLDRENRVIRKVQHLRPWHPGVWAWRAGTTVEFPAGILDRVNTGDRIRMENVPEFQPDKKKKNREQQIMKLFFVNGLRSGEELDFAIPEITVGRELDNVVIIPVEGVSRHHGKICRQSNGKWTVEDTGSTNGIKCNRQRIHGPHELCEGDLLEFGDQMIRVTGLLATAPVVFSSLQDEVPGEVKVTPPKTSVQMEEIKIAPAPAAPVMEEIKIAPAPAPAASAPKGHPPTPAPAAVPKKQTAKELSEALKNGKLHLFGNKPGRTDDHTQSGGSPENSDSPGREKHRFSNRIYYTLIICLAIMGIAAFYKINLQPAAQPQETNQQDSRNAKRFMLYYEKQIISPDNVFYFVLHIENGEATFKIDDLKSSRSFTRNKIPFTLEAYEKFHADLEHENFFKTASRGEAPDDGDRRDHRRLVICDQGRLHELNIKNNMRPSAFERLEMTINLFAENYALRTVSMTPEELREQALDCFNKAEDLFQNRHSRHANLREAIHRYRLTVEYLNAFVPKPALWDRARKQLEEAERIRDNRLAELRSERIRLGQLKEFSEVLPVLDEIMALSDQDSPVFSDARKMRIQIDSYLRKHGDRRK